MFFIYNTSKNSVTLTATGMDDNSSMVAINLIVTNANDDSQTMEYPIAFVDKKENPELANVVIKQFKDREKPFVITSDLYRKKFVVTDKVIKFKDDYKMIEIDKNDNERRSKFSKNSAVALITITSKDGETYIDSRNTIEIATKCKTSEFAKICQIQYRWSNWKDLKYPIMVGIRDVSNSTFVSLSASTEVIKREKYSYDMNCLNKKDLTSEEFDELLSRWFTPRKKKDVRVTDNEERPKKKPFFKDRNFNNDKGNKKFSRKPNNGTNRKVITTYNGKR